MRFINIFQTKSSDSPRWQVPYAGRRVPLLFSLFLAALLSVTAYIDRTWADVPTIVSLSDVDSSGSPELSALMRDTVDAKNYAYVMDANDGAQITRVEVNAFNAFEPLMQVVVPDINGNGADEIAMLGVIKDGSGVVTDIKVYVRDARSGSYIKTLGFAADFPPVDMEVVEFPNGDVGMAMLGVRPSDGKGRVTVKNIATGAVMGAALSFPSSYPAIAMAVVPDFGGTSNGPEIAVLGVGSLGNIKVIIKDSSGSAGSWIKTIGFDADFPPVDMAVVEYASGVVGIALLGVGISNSNIKVAIKDVATSTAVVPALLFDREYPPVAMAVLPDMNGNGAPEIAVLGLGETSLGASVQNKTRITIKDASDGSGIQSIYLGASYVSKSMAVLDDFAKTSAPEIVVLGVNSSGGEKITIKDASSTGTIGSFLLPPYVSGPSGDISRLSVASDGTQGNTASDYPSISSDGRYVAFRSSANKLVAGDANRSSDVFVRDTINNTITRVSLDSSGAEGNGDSGYPSVNSDGRYVVFKSSATNLVAGDTNGFADIFMHDTQTGETTRVSLAFDGAEGNGDSGDKNRSVAISDSGRYVAFVSCASNLVPGDTNGAPDVFLRDTVDNATTRISVGATGGMGGMGGMGNSGDSEAGISISADGRYVVFRSSASDIVLNDTNGAYDIFVRDRVANATTRVSVGPEVFRMNVMGVTESNGDSGGSFISSDGRYVSFKSVASNLVAGDTNGTSDIFVRDMVANTTTRVSLASDWTQGDGGVGASSISSYGRYVTFKSSATNLVADDTNGVTDIFVRDILANTTTRISVAADGTQGNGRSYGASISSDGQYVTFTSYASNLVAGDTNGTWDVFHTLR